MRKWEWKQGNRKPRAAAGPASGFSPLVIPARQAQGGDADRGQHVNHWENSFGIAIKEAEHA